MYVYIVTMNWLLFASVCLPTLFVNVYSNSRPYKIIFERVTSADDNYYFAAKFRTGKINRTTLAAQGYAKLLRPLPKNIMASLQMYEFFRNEYRPFAISMRKPFCDALSTEYKLMFYPDFVKGGGNFFPTSCPLELKNYTMGNYVPDANNFPPALPFNKIRFEYKMWFQDKMILNINAYAKFDRDAIIRERYT